MIKHVRLNAVVHLSLTSSGSLGTGPSLKCNAVNQNIPKTYVNILFISMKGRSGKRGRAERNSEIVEF